MPHITLWLLGRWLVPEGPHRKLDYRIDMFGSHLCIVRHLIVL